MNKIISALKNRFKEYQEENFLAKVREITEVEFSEKTLPMRNGKNTYWHLFELGENSFTVGFNGKNFCFDMYRLKKNILCWREKNNVRISYVETNKAKEIYSLIRKLKAFSQKEENTSE